MERTKSLGTDSVGKLLAKYSIPAIIGMLVMASYNLVDRIFVGRGVGSLALSGIAVTMPIIIIVMGFGLLVGIGATSLVSIRLGEKNKDGAERILGNAITLSLLLSLVLTLAIWFYMEPFLILLGASGQVLVYATEFSRIAVWTIIFQSLTMTLNNVIRGQGDPKLAMVTMIVGSVINIILNPIFIFTLHWGIQGSAYATLISNVISSVWVFWYFRTKRSHLKIHWKYLNLDWEIIKSILKIGISPFMMQVLASVVVTISNQSLAHWGGDLAIASLGIINAIYMLVFMPVVGINQGVQPIIGYNFGAKNYKRVHEALRLSIIAASAISVSAFIIIMLFDKQIVQAFSKNDLNLTAIGSHGLKIIAIMMPFFGFQIIVSGYFMAVNKAKHSAILTLLRQAILLIPLLIILPRYLHVDGVWLSTPIADFMSTILSGIFMYAEMKKLTQLEHGLTPVYNEAG